MTTADRVMTEKEKKITKSTWKVLLSVVFARTFLAQYQNITESTIHLVSSASMIIFCLPQNTLSSIWKPFEIKWCAIEGLHYKLISRQKLIKSITKNWMYFFLKAWSFLKENFLDCVSRLYEGERDIIGKGSYEQHDQPLKSWTHLPDYLKLTNIVTKSIEFYSSF